MPEMLCLVGWEMERVDQLLEYLCVHRTWMSRDTGGSFPAWEGVKLTESFLKGVTLGLSPEGWVGS